MRILFVHSGSDLYGASRSLARLCAALAADGHAAAAVLPRDGPLAMELRRVGAEVVAESDMPLLDRSAKALACSVLRLPRATCRLRRLIRSFNPDLVHTNTATVLLASGLAARLEHRPHLWHVRESFADFARLWPLYRRCLLSLSDRIVCVSAAVAGQFPAAAQGRQVVVLHNALPLAEFSPVEPGRIAAFRTAHGLEGNLAVGVVGRIKLRRKGQETFVQAAAALAQCFPSARFLVIGSPFPGNEKHLADLRALIARLGLAERVICTGDVADIRAAIASLDVMVLPSGTPEPFSGSVLEAMAYAKPVVGTSTGGTPEQVEDGKTGFLVPPGDAGAMARALERLLADDGMRRRMGAAGRRRMEEEFSFDKFYAAVTAMYVALSTSRSGAGEEA